MPPWFFVGCDAPVTPASKGEHAVARAVTPPAITRPLRRSRHQLRRRQRTAPIRDGIAHDGRRGPPYRQASPLRSRDDEFCVCSVATVRKQPYGEVMYAERPIGDCVTRSLPLPTTATRKLFSSLMLRASPFPSFGVAISARRVLMLTVPRFDCPTRFPRTA